MTHSFISLPSMHLLNKRMSKSFACFLFFLKVWLLRFLYVMWVIPRPCMWFVFLVYSFYFHFLNHSFLKNRSFNWRHLFPLNFMSLPYVGTMPKNSCLLLNQKILFYASLYASHFVIFFNKMWDLGQSSLPSPLSPLPF